MKMKLDDKYMYYIQMDKCETELMFSHGHYEDAATGIDICKYMYGLHLNYYPTISGTYFAYYEPCKI